MLGLDLQVFRRRVGAIQRLTRGLSAIATTALEYLGSGYRPKQKVAAENLFPRKQLALFEERGIKPRRADEVTRVAMFWLSRALNWREALVIVKPATLVRWHREGFRRFWEFKSRPGRSALPHAVQKLIRQLVAENPTWGEERIANELLIKLGLQVSPRTVR